MNYSIADLISRVVATACCLAALLAVAPAHAAMPDSTPAEAPSVAEREAAYDQLLSRMFTPEAEIRLGPGRADTRQIMRRASRPSLSYTISSLWAGIVEYVFPPHGLFRRSDLIARVYDPELLSDLEHARERMGAEDVAPLTIAAPSPPPPQESEAEAPAERSDIQDPPPEAADAPPPASSLSHGRPEASAGEAPAEEAASPLPEIPDFDFEANGRRQDELREQAQLVASAIPEALEQCAAAREKLDVAREELASRHRLLEQGALAREALRPAEERVAKARAACDRAEARLAEAQEGYERISGRIAALQEEAEAAHEAIQMARAARAEQAAATSRQQAPPTAESQAPLQEPPEIALEPRGDAETDGRDDQTAEPSSTEGEVEPDDAEAVRVYHITDQMRDIAAERWEEVAAEAPGAVSEVLAPEGSVVEAGDDLLRVANLQLARVTATVPADHLPDFQVGRSVTITFQDYPDVVFGGWVEDVAPVAGTDEASVSLMVVSRGGRFAHDPYLALRWMTLEAGVGADKVEARSLQPALRAPRSARTDVHLARMFPTIAPSEAWEQRVTKPRVPVEDRFTGRLQVQPMDRLVDAGAYEADGGGRLAELCEWRETFIDGMTTTMLEDGTCISYPADGDVSDAVRMMLEGNVSHRRNLCAATMREALGWGLGDAHQWATRLPRRGYVPREDGLPRPGDILVWPFTYGPSHSEHIGFAVRQGRKLMLLSNLAGRLGTTEILGGYIAFYRPAAGAAG